MAWVGRSKIALSPLSINAFSHNYLDIIDNIRFQILCISNLTKEKMIMTKRAHYLFAYDIGEPKRQHRIRRALKAYAIGHQKSLYECWLTAGEYQALCRQVHSLLQAQDKLLTFKIPPDDGSQLYGNAARLQYSPFIIL